MRLSRSNKVFLKSLLFSLVTLIFFTGLAFLRDGIVSRSVLAASLFFSLLGGLGWIVEHLPEAEHEDLRDTIRTLAEERRQERNNLEDALERSFNAESKQVLESKQQPIPSEPTNESILEELGYQFGLGPDTTLAPKNFEKVDARFFCSANKTVMNKPVLLNSGHSVEFSAIPKLNGKCPLTRESIIFPVQPNFKLKKEIDNFVERAQTKHKMLLPNTSMSQTTSASESSSSSTSSSTPSQQNLFNSLLEQPSNPSNSGLFSATFSSSSTTEAKINENEGEDLDLENQSLLKKN